MPVIKAENLSKAYQLGQIGTGTISRDLERWWAKMRGKEDPFLKIGEINDRLAGNATDIIWSLKGLDFEIEQGDAVGIVGRNGAGKSTLLKILSRVTAPTTGSVKIKGRIASLLEVGTGFHPELTGRENIYLNGAILGMRKAEIKRKFDEIVDFAGVDRYVDTPVKRYSSGMYMRLAFAVAAHLESEILIIDEVLAVGDAEFQKKCLGKMGEVSKGEGRTVLFVSHQMNAIQSFCNKGILLANGILAYEGPVNDTLQKYQHSNSNVKDALLRKYQFNKGNILEIVNFQINVTDIDLRFRITLAHSETVRSLVITVSDKIGQRIALIDLRAQLTEIKSETFEVCNTINHEGLVENDYDFGISIETSIRWYDFKTIIPAEIPAKKTAIMPYEPYLRGYLNLPHTYTIKNAR